MGQRRYPDCVAREGKPRLRALEDVVAFYVERDTRPERWFHSRAPGRPSGPTDDLPPRYDANLNRDPPFGGARRGSPPLTAAEIRDVVAFLKTLTDADLAAVKP